MIIKAQKLYKIGKKEQAFDYIFDIIDGFFVDRKFENVDRILEKIDTLRCDVDILVCVLVATLPAKNQLKQREDFYKRVEKTFRDILKGLD